MKTLSQSDLQLLLNEEINETIRKFTLNFPEMDLGTIYYSIADSKLDVPYIFQVPDGRSPV